ncbi:hypothetical protein E2C01_009655 [Portunus trituberculatus]|uniref:Uncharacterized protein n=1 Tax=Portunus trituberculatus TaxID=210409 RepID=A0A5B7D6B8_PORTR|nr:hypothetical protein [Portunus trituberculatus]
MGNLSPYGILWQLTEGSTRTLPRQSSVLPYR